MQPGVTYGIIMNRFWMLFGVYRIPVLRVKDFAVTTNRFPEHPRTRLCSHHCCRQNIKKMNVIYCDWLPSDWFPTLCHCFGMFWPRSTLGSYPNQIPILLWSGMLLYCCLKIVLVKPKSCWRRPKAKGGNAVGFVFLKFMCLWIRRVMGIYNYIILIRENDH